MREEAPWVAALGQHTCGPRHRPQQHRSWTTWGIWRQSPGQTVCVCFVKTGSKIQFDCIAHGSWAQVFCEPFPP